MWSLLVRQPQGDGAAAQHHQRRCSLGGVETESATSDEANGRVSSLHAAVAESQADGGEDPVAVFADGAAGRNAPASRCSSSWAAPSATTATGSSPPSAWDSATAAWRDETRPFASSLVALSVSTPPRLCLLYTSPSPR